MKLNDKEHFEEIKRRAADEKSDVFVNGIKAGFDPNQARNQDGTWGGGGIGDKLLKLSEYPKTPDHKVDKHGRITEGKVHLYHSTNGLENLNNIVTNGINLDKQTAVQGLFFAKLGSPYRKHDSFVVLEMDIKDVPWGNRFFGSEVAFGRIENYKIVHASKLSPDNMRTIKHFHRIFKRDGLKGLEKSLDNFIKYEGKDNEVSKIVSSLISSEKNKKTAVFINGVKAGFKPDQRRGRDGRWAKADSISMRELEDRIRDQEYETSGVYDENGNLIFTKDGDENKVSFTDYELEAMRGMDITHNHPYPGTGALSIADLSTAMYNKINSIKSVARNGDWTKAVFNYDYIDSLIEKVSEIHNIPIEEISLGGLIGQIADSRQKVFERENMFDIMLAQSTGSKDDLYRLNKRFGDELMSSFSEGLKEHEENWAPMEIDKLWTITRGTDEI